MKLRNASPISKWWALIATGLSSFIIAIDITIANTCLADIQKSMVASFSEMQWMIVGFGLTFCTFLVTIGRLGDLIGRRKVLYISMILFGLASLGAGLSEAVWELIFWRFIQGFCGAAIFPCGMAITASAFPEKQRGRALGIYGGILGTGLAIGPVLGGLIVDLLSWRWIFFINLPVIAMSLLLCFLFVQESKKEGKVNIDGGGVILLTLGLSGLIFALMEGPNLSWHSPWILSGFVISAISFIILFFAENRVKEPLLPLVLFKNRGFLVGTLVNFSAVSLAWPIIFFVPLYLQNVLGFTAAFTGLLILPMTVMVALAPPIAGHFYDKWGASKIMILLFSSVIAAYVLQLYFGLMPSMLMLFFAFVLFGIAWGIGNGIGIPLSLSNLKSTEDAGLVSGAAVTLLNTLGMVALAFTGVIFRYAETSELFKQLQNEKISLSSEKITSIRRLLFSSDALSELQKEFSPSLGHKLIDVFRTSFVSGFHAVIGLQLCLTILAALIIIFSQKRIARR